MVTGRDLADLPTPDRVAVNVSLINPVMQARLRLLDLAGREVQQHVVRHTQQQVVLDTRRLAPGAYLVELINEGKPVATEKLIVQP